ncbi:MAG: hypothetical protein WCI11_12970 [Candidatus Methylumidiphilus sp.]
MQDLTPFFGILWVRRVGRETVQGIRGFCSFYPFGAIRGVPLLRLTALPLRGYRPLHYSRANPALYKDKHHLPRSKMFQLDRAAYQQFFLFGHGLGFLICVLAKDLKTHIFLLGDKITRTVRFPPHRTRP